MAASVTRPASAWVLVAGVAAAVAGLLLLENLGSRQMYAVSLYLPGIDKVLHFVQSFLVCLLLFAVSKHTGMSRTSRVALAVTGSLAAAGLDEFQQTWRSDRSVEIADIGAGIGGILVAVAAMTRAMRPKTAAVTALAGLALSTALTYDSYLRTRDYNRGVLSERAGRPDQALQHYLASVNAGYDNPEAYNAVAWLMAESGLGDPQDAVVYAARSLELRPDNPDSLDTYGWTLFRAGQSEKALGALEAALAADPTIYCIHYHLGMTYLRLGRREEGIHHLRQQVTVEPMTREAELAAGELARLDQAHAQ